jgi:hypothetical protein
LTRNGSRARGLLATLAAFVALAAFTVAPAAAITDGQPTGPNAYNHVGLMTAHAEDGDYMHRCSGTLISPTVFVTAGHCTFGADYAVVYFDAGPINPDPNYNPTTRSCFLANGDPIAGYPCGGGIVGEVYTSPDYDDDAFYLNDLGVVVLSQPVILDEYAELPEAGSLDDLRVGTGFTSVGYGLQKSFPDAAAWKDVAIRERMIAHPRLLQINKGIVGDYSILLSNNAHTGGTCFGDSGGPNFLRGTNILAGVTSYGINPTCAGVGGIYRLDNAEDIAWIESFL